jgi:hypothetical protein
MLKSAWASAGAPFTPSPAIATRSTVVSIGVHAFECLRRVSARCINCIR